MSKARLTRAWIATFVALSLLFSQIATAAYSCPQVFKVAAADHDASSMTDCEFMSMGDMDKERPSLCKAHCDSGNQSNQSKTGADHVWPSGDVHWCLAWLLPPLRLPVETLAVFKPAPERTPGAPPLYLVHQVFRL